MAIFKIKEIMQQNVRSIVNDTQMLAVEVGMTNWEGR